MVSQKQKTKTRQAPGKGSTKGCIKGKGGPQNTKCSFRGVSQRTWCKWIAEIREPRGHKLWLGTFPSELEAARAYDEAARKMYGSLASINFPNYSSGDSSQLSCNSTLTCSQSEYSQLRDSKKAKNVCEEVDVTGISNDDDYDHMIDIDELLGVKDCEISEVVNNQRDMFHVDELLHEIRYDAWFENKPDDFDFDFDFSLEQCNFKLEDLGLDPY